MSGPHQKNSRHLKEERWTLCLYHRCLVLKCSQSRPSKPNRQPVGPDPNVWPAPIHWHFMCHKIWNKVRTALLYFDLHALRSSTRQHHSPAKPLSSKQIITSKSQIINNSPKPRMSTRKTISSNLTGPIGFVLFYWTMSMLDRHVLYAARP